MKWYNKLWFRFILVLIAFGLTVYGCIISWKAALLVILSWWLCNIDDQLKPKG